MTITGSSRPASELPRRSPAAILAESRAPLVIDEVELPESLECGQVLVAVLYAGLCGSQIGEIEAVKGPDRYLPHLLGHEGGGRVLAVGPGVTRTRPGDLGVLHWRPGPGIAAAPPRYRWRGRPLSAGPVAVFTRYAVVSENRFTPVVPSPEWGIDRPGTGSIASPSYLDPKILPWFGCAVTTGLGVVTADAQIRIGESVVVFGAGGVGLNVIQGAVLAGAWPVIAVDLHEGRLALAAEFGASHLIKARPGASGPDSGAEIRAVLAGHGQPEGADVCVDLTGAPEVVAQAYDLAGPGGRVVLVGVAGPDRPAVLPILPLLLGKKLIGSHGGEARPEVDIPRYLRLWRAGKLKLEQLATEEYPLAGINTAIERMRSGALAGRARIDCGAGAEAPR